MYKVHGYLDDKRVIDWRMQHLPRNGDTVRLPGKNGPRYGTVTEVVWCMDESNGVGEPQRVNLRMVTAAEIE